MVKRGPAYNRKPISRWRIERSRILRLFFPSYLVLSLLAVIALALLARRKPYFQADLAIEKRVQSFRAPWFDRLMHSISSFGSLPQAGLFFGGIILLLYLLGYRAEATAESLLVAGSITSYSIGMLFVRRPRPSPDLVKVSNTYTLTGFPSGHVSNLTAIIGFLWFRIYAARQHPFLRMLALTILGAFILLIGPSRIYTGEHWPSDVLAGYLIGATWLSIVLRGYQRK